MKSKVAAVIVFNFALTENKAALAILNPQEPRFMTQHHNQPSAFLQPPPNAQAKKAVSTHGKTQAALILDSAERSVRAGAALTRLGRLLRAGLQPTDSHTRRTELNQSEKASYRPSSLRLWKSEVFTLSSNTHSESLQPKI